MVDRPRQWYVRGSRAEAAGDHGEAERAFRWVIRLDRPRPWGHLALARFLTRRHRFSEALDAYRGAFTLTPALVEPINSEFAEFLWTTPPHKDWVAFELLWRWSLDGCRRYSIWAAARAVAMPPSDHSEYPHWHRLLLQVAHTLGDHVLAARISAPLPAAPNTGQPTSECPIGHLLEWARPLVGCNAVEALQNARDRAPTSPVVLDALARAHQECGMPRSALEPILYAAELAPTERRLRDAEDLARTLGDPELADDLAERRAALAVR